MVELLALSEQMVADGETPWCIGLGSGAATGWPRDRLGRDHHADARSPPEVYDAWVSNEMPLSTIRA